jgi:hypothetical protein
MMRFFNGPVVEYYAIQNQDITKGEISPELKKRTRETILSDALGYDIQLLNRKERRRKSTSDFRSTQEWNDFLQTVEETIFDSAGYEFPKSKDFWELSDKHGYEEAKRIAREQLQTRIIGRLSTD